MKTYRNSHEPLPISPQCNMVNVKPPSWPEFLDDAMFSDTSRGFHAIGQHLSG